MKHSLAFLFPFLPSVHPQVYFETPDGDSGGAPPSSPSLVSGEDTVAAGDDTLEGGDDTVPSGDETPEDKDDDNSDDKDEDEKPPVEPITMEDIELPEGMQIPEEAQEDFLKLLNDPELTPTQRINQLIAMQGASIEQAAHTAKEEAVNSWLTLRENWRKECATLPEIGGENSAKTLADIRKGIEAVGMGSVTEALDITGAGDHPQVVQLLHKLVQPFLEKAPTSGDPVTEQRNRAQKMYPSMNKKE